ncbi:g7122 [Coccomyxa viridis]|uniref:G7122 protein n=1 Tax=Coccomyxa viridis TaxID=1274662 RepID=A0ABP1FZH7_9CHLO
MRAATTLVLLIAGISVLSSVQGLNYFTGQTHRRTLQQGTGIGGNTCQNGAKSAEYRCMSLSSRSSGYQFCARLCQPGLGRASAANDDDNSPTPGSIGGNSTRLDVGAGGLGGSALGSSGMGSVGAGGCQPCIDVTQQCQQGESSGGGISRGAFRAYVNRYYSGPACQDVSISGGSSSGSSSGTSDSPPGGR